MPNNCGQRRRGRKSNTYVSLLRLVVAGETKIQVILCFEAANIHYKSMFLLHLIDVLYVVFTITYITTSRKFHKIIIF